MLHVARVTQHGALLADLSESSFDLSSEDGGFDFLIGVEIPQRTPSIEVAQTDRSPVVAQSELTMQKPLPILVDHDPIGEKSREDIDGLLFAPAVHRYGGRSVRAVRHDDGWSRRPGSSNDWCRRRPPGLSAASTQLLTDSQSDKQRSALRPAGRSR
jgi:hypothetical protein